MKKSVLLSLILAANLAWADGSHWGYDGDLSPENWGTMEDAKTCSSGQKQSPIDILNSVEDQKLPAISFNYGAGHLTNIVDNGHSLQFNFQKGNHITYNDKEYTLVQFHAHEDAEHTIEGVRYPLELHFVHQAEDGSILVIAVFVKEGADNSYFEKLSAFKDLAKAGSLDTDIAFNPEELYPTDKAYYTYSGSLTTPPCSEPVTWILFKQPITMSVAEIEDIAKHLPKHNNRPIQPLNDRVISNN
ncbi:carbonic anhydrase family protein [Neisseriaceae bacterium ESL0693]|nr:carbonic anhydrase family protein [Neisseriaceae bacterium ESL0693]